MRNIVGYASRGGRKKGSTRMTLFCCDEANGITEKAYDGIEAGFCIVESFDYVYQKELPRFRAVPGAKPYGLPCGDTPRKEYLGIGNPSFEKTPQDSAFYTDSCLRPENEVIAIRDTLFSEEACDVVWFRVCGSDAAAPEGYVSCGYDVTYEPDINGAFSVINDCMFICKWHGCDEAGEAFAGFFAALNPNGLFDKAETAMRYMTYYLSFDWAERGEYCLCEVFRKRARQTATR